MVDFKYHGDLDSLHVAGEALSRGMRVTLNSSGQWVKATATTKGMGWCYPTVRALSSGIDIYNSSYDAGLTSTYNGRRNANRFLANVGDPIGVAIGAGVEMDQYDLYSGSIAIGDPLEVGPSGLLIYASGDADTYVARAMSAGSSAAGDKISILGL